jgi:3-hydroxy-9,10-secoandrosta-1,3,5(10)-triene-9,17-dione monooxygenase reductase component
MQVTADGSSAIDPAEFRQVLGTFSSGLTVITSIGGAGEPYGFTCQSFASLSLDPALVVFCPSAGSSTWPRIRATGRFCVSVLAGDQRDIALRFAVSGGDKFEGVPRVPVFGGLPVIDGAIAWVAGTIADEHPAGDHTIVVGRVHELAVRRDASPLVCHRGEFGEFSAA